MANDDWDDPFRSPSPESDLGDDEVVGNGLGGFGDLAKELDLSSRHDTVTFTKTPFTIAAANGRNGSNGGGSKRTSIKSVRMAAPEAAPPPQPTAGPSTKPQAKKYNARQLTANITRAPAQSNGKGNSTPAPAPAPVVKKPRNSGWYDSFGNPIPKTPPKPKPKKINDKLDDWETKERKKKERNAKAAATRAKNKRLKQEKEQEEIKFGIMPSGATANDEFPILQGIAKMKDLPTKAKTTKGKDKKGKKKEEEEEIKKTKLGAEALHKLIFGDPTQKEDDTNKGKEKEKTDEIESIQPVKEKEDTPSQISKRERELSLQEIIEKSSRETERKHNGKKRQLWEPTRNKDSNLRPTSNGKDDSFRYLSTGTAKPKNDELSPTIRPKNVEPLFITPPPDDDFEIISVDQPSTITQLPSSALRKIDEAGNTSSEAAPPTSPLDQHSEKPAGLLEPRPFKPGRNYMDIEGVERLERSVEDEGYSQNHASSSRLNSLVLQNKRSEDNQQQLPTPQTSAFYQRISERSNSFNPSFSSQTTKLFSKKHPRTPSPTESIKETEQKEWSTLPTTTRGWDKQRKITKFKENKLDNKFRTPLNLFPKKNNGKITDEFRNSINTDISPFKFFNFTNHSNSKSNGNSSSSLKSKPIVESVLNGKATLKLFTPNKIDEDNFLQNPNRIQYDLHTNKGNKYGSSVSSNSQERSKPKNFLTTNYQEEEYDRSSSSNLGISNMVNGYINSHHGPSNQYKRSYTTGTTYLPKNYSQNQYDLAINGNYQNGNHQNGIHQNGNNQNQHHSSPYGQEFTPRQTSNRDTHFRPSQSTNHPSQNTYHPSQNTYHPNIQRVPSYPVHPLSQPFVTDNSYTQQQEEEDWTRAWSKSAKNKTTATG